MTADWWWNEAACQEMDPALWFPDKGNPARDARDVCAHCPVRTNCLNSALKEERGLLAGSRHGIRGGLSGTQRVAEEKRRKNEVAA